MKGLCTWQSNTFDPLWQTSKSSSEPLSGHQSAQVRSKGLSTERRRKVQLDEMGGLRKMVLQLMKLQQLSALSTARASNT